MSDDRASGAVPEATGDFRKQEFDIGKRFCLSDEPLQVSEGGVIRGARYGWAGGVLGILAVLVGLVAERVFGLSFVQGGCSSAGLLLAAVVGAMLALCGGLLIITRTVRRGVIDLARNLVIVPTGAFSRTKARVADIAAIQLGSFVGAFPQERGFGLHLVMGEGEEDQPLFHSRMLAADAREDGRRLAEVLDVPLSDGLAVDESVSTDHTPDDVVLQIPRVPARQFVQGSDAGPLCSPAEDILLGGRTIGNPFPVMLLAMLPGMFVLFSMPFVMISMLESHWGRALFLVFGWLLAAGISIGLARLLSRRSVADRAAGLLRLYRGWWRWEERPLEEVIAVQLCPGIGLFKADRCREVNLVMGKPWGQRLVFHTRTDPQAAHADASRLAEFLGVPLLDHTIRSQDGDVPDGSGAGGLCSS